MDAFTHVVIPDTQSKPGAPTDHLRWVGQYIVDHFAGRDNIRIIHLGDHWDMSSLSSYDKGKKSMEGRRVQADIDAGNKALDVLDGPLEQYNAQRRATKHAQWLPDKHLLNGNHENRITRAVEDDAQMDGFLSLDLINDKARANGWTVHPFLEVLELEGVCYSHYFYQPNSGRPYSGMAETRLKNVGYSFTMGHQQGFQSAQRSVRGSRHRALIAGSCYLHAEEYRGPQAADEWRGILVCHQVQDGNYDLMEVSLDYLCRRYEGMPLEKFLRRKYPLLRSDLALAA